VRRERWGRGGRRKWRGGKGRAPKSLLNQGPSEPCYAHWLLLDSLHKFKILLFVHKFFSHHPDQLPPIFVSYFVKKKSDLHSHDTSSKDKSHFQFFTTSLSQLSIKYKGCYLWCSLPDHLKLITSTRLFKLQLKIFPKSITNYSHVYV